ncbi:MAG: tRNA pseudouridine(55) synthase TruB [Pseudomonadota bacterium]
MLNEAVFVVDKPVGPTSFDIVRDLKRVFRGEKVGHAGSLDPFATGVLILLLGRATKFSNALMNSDKVYQATLKLGSETDSFDLTGKTVKTAPIPPLDRDQVINCLKSFEGEWLQLPPMFSAKKVQGVRLYELARKNVTIPRERTAVQLHRLELIHLAPSELVFEVHCSKGTYIRSLGKEIAEKLGTVGHLSGLRRLSCGPFSIQASSKVEEIQADPERFRRLGYENFSNLFRM